MYNKKNVVIFFSLFCFGAYNLQAQCTAGSLDSDQDGICDIEDMDDDNDGILDAKETVCSASLLDFTFYGQGVDNVDANTIYPTSNNAWRTSYSNEILSLPIHIEYRGDISHYAMVGLLPLNANETITNWDDDAYKLFTHTNNILYAKLPRQWTFTRPDYDNKLLEIDIYETGTLNITMDGSVIYTTNAPVTDYRLAISGYNGGAIEEFKITYKQVPCIEEDIDTDGDGTPDRLDLDSDNDLCVDAFEGGADLSINDMDNDGRLTGGVITNSSSPYYGVPIIAGTGQSIGESTIFYAVGTDIRECLCLPFNNPIDSDGDGVCDVADLCDAIPDNLIGTPCDDGDICTINDEWTINCVCEGTIIDSDGDAICDMLDICPDYDNDIDVDDDDIPDCQDNCIDVDEDGICDNVDNIVVPDELEVYTTHRRGFYEEAFNQHMFTNAPNASIYYTSDGSVPSNASQLYDGNPILIDSTTILRIVAYTAQATAAIETHSFVFLDDIITDPTLKTYITQHPVWGEQLKDALQSVPSVSLVTDSTLNAVAQVSGSMEVLFRDKEDNFQANCGLGNYGNHSLSFDKRNIRMYFDSIYGPKNLKFPIFEGFDSGLEATDKFDKLDLRSSHENWIWNNTGFPWHEGETFMTTKLLDDIMLRGGSPNPHNRFVHVYLDGKYWGMFDLREKFDDNMMQEYLGGDNSDYNFISGSKVTIDAFHPIAGVIKDTTNNDWEIMIQNSDDYLTWKTMANENSFFDVMLLFMYGFAEAEWNATGAHSNGKEFVFQINDADLFFSRGYPQWTNRTYPQHNANGPDNMFLNLFNEGHPDFLQDFADRAAYMYTNDGPLTPATLKAHMDELAAMIEQPIIGEAAKWSSENSEHPDQWRQKLDSFKVNMVDIRTDIVLGQMKKSGIYPNLDPVTFSVPQGLVTVNTPLDIINPNTSGTIYYTLDGTDPRASGGSISPTGLSYQGTLSIPQGVTQVNARIKGQQTTYPENNMAPGKPISASKVFKAIEYANDTVIWGTVNYADVGVNANQDPWLEIDLGAIEDIDIVRVWGNSAYESADRMIKPYIFISNQPIVGQLVADVLLESGVHAFQYPGNGAQVFEIPVNTQGRYVRVMTDNSIRFNCSEFEIIEIDYNNPTVKDIWSPMVPKIYYTDQGYSGIVINEIMYHPDSLCTAGDPDELDYVELHNAGNANINLAGSNFTDGISFKFPYPTILQPGDFLVLAENTTEFQANYGFAPYGQYKGRLDNNGETLQLSAPFGNLIDSVKYNDKNPWDEHPDGDGPSLELLNPTSDNADPVSWFRSDNSCGTPAAVNSRICTGTSDIIVINEINYNSNNGATDPGDWVELHNPNAIPVDISDWTFYDNSNEFIFPSGTIIQPDDYLVLVEDDVIFNGIFPHLANNGSLGNFAFNLSSKGERISLFDKNKCLSDYVIYNDKLPWDTIPDGNGPTLSLITPNSDNTQAQSWEASSNINSAYGTPGRANEPCLENVIELPNLICAGFPVEIKVDSAYSEMDFTWFASGATPLSFTTDSETLTWNNPGTYNLQLITKYFEYTKVYTQQITVEDCNTTPNIVDDNFTINEDNVLSNNVLINDNDPNNNNLIVNTTPLNNVSNGTLVLNPDGTFDYTPNPDFNGTDSFTYEVCDDATFPAMIPGSFVGQVAAGADDVEELLDGTIETTSSDLDIMEDSPDFYAAIGIRITGVTVPQGAIVTGAYLEFVADESQSVATSLAISAEATGNAAAIPTTASALTSKTKTTATISWANLPAWTTGNTYQSADIGPVVQEITNRGDWSNGNAMTFIIEGTGRRTAESFNGTAPPKLVVNYEIPTPTNVSLCNTAVVTINVAPVNDAPQATNDNATITEDTPKTGNAMSNDNDVDGDNLALNITPVTAPQNGSVFLLASGFYSYTPNPDFNGTDTFEYEVCDDGNPVMCNTATVTIDVTPANDAPIPAIDTLYTVVNSMVQHNILVNDTDIDNDNLTATAISMAAPTNGSVTIQSNGNVNYTPNTDFIGTDSFTYEVCDDGVPSLCNIGTVVVIVEPDCVDIQLFAWLEGAYLPTLGEMRTTLAATRKLLPGQTPTSNLVIPTPAGQPYSATPWNYAGTEGAAWTDADYTGDETDWVLVSFRTGTAKSTEVAMTAGLLMKDGSIEFSDRCALLSTIASPLYIVLEHRNHIGVMTPQPVNVISSTLTYDFRWSDSFRDPTSFGQKQLPTGEWTMYAGDADQSDFPSFDIKGTDKTIWFDNNGVFDYYFSPDFNLDGDINGQDKSLWFDNNGISSRVPK